ncbi:hypothetical protein Dsin_014840 [Dipteronia sinensis]|uniref:Reverse transcriptase domain-containing protein n=1 Tax=Dipteronia sinensis TaxID=43782 RepID=A0AAE0EBY7_9ROSI|nr:hypothetical protein Dsin_014840 [Dipteronia sinensis]
MRMVISSVIGETQMIFITNRQILDSFVIAEEIIHHWKKKNEGGFNGETGFQKVYDSLDHAFLDNMLNDMGFGWKWRQWIQSCISSHVLAVLVNGKPTKEFWMEMSLRQGDPLSPFMFNVAVEGLSALLRKEVNLDMMKGVVFGVDVVHITHLQFAYDTILFLQPKVEYVINARRILRCFELASGLRINFHKSCMVEVGIRGVTAINCAGILRCAKDALSISYLGLPLGGRPCSKIF